LIFHKSFINQRLSETVPDPVLVSVPDPVFGPDQSSDYGESNIQNLLAVRRQKF